MSKKLISVLDEISSIRTVQFLGYGDEYVYNYLGLEKATENNRIYINISISYDNIPVHSINPLKTDSEREIYCRLRLMVYINIISEKEF